MGMSYELVVRFISEGGKGAFPERREKSKGIGSGFKGSIKYFKGLQCPYIFCFSNLFVRRCIVRSGML